MWRSTVYSKRVVLLPDGIITQHNPVEFACLKSASRGTFTQRCGRERRASLLVLAAGSGGGGEGGEGVELYATERRDFAAVVGRTRVHIYYKNYICTATISVSRDSRRTLSPGTAWLYSSIIGNCCCWRFYRGRAAKKQFVR